MKKIEKEILTDMIRHYPKIFDPKKVTCYPPQKNQRCSSTMTISSTPPSHSNGSSCTLDWGPRGLAFAKFPKLKYGKLFGVNVYSSM